MSNREVSRRNVLGHDRADADEHATAAKPVQQILECGKHWQNLSVGASLNAIAESSLSVWRRPEPCGTQCLGLSRVLRLFSVCDLCKGSDATHEYSWHTHRA